MMHDGKMLIVREWLYGFMQPLGQREWKSWQDMGPVVSRGRGREASQKGLSEGSWR